MSRGLSPRGGHEARFRAVPICAFKETAVQDLSSFEFMSPVSVCDSVCEKLRCEATFGVRMLGRMSSNSLENTYPSALMLTDCVYSE
jgi:hypothetical protein